MANHHQNNQVSVIDTFYDNRKGLYDICGNIINRDKYKFVDILATYLTDIVDSIDAEIKQSTRNSMINWREKKNPKLLSKFINSDDNINIINRSMNKITATNYMVIVSEITETLTHYNFRKLPEYSKFLFDTVIKKCMNDESFTKDYLNFLVGFDGTIGKYITQYITQFITEMYSLLEKNADLKSFTYFSYIKDIVNYTNIGIIFANLYIIQNEKKTQYKITDDNLYDNFGRCLVTINGFLDWMPSQMDELNGRIYMIFGIFETISKTILRIMKPEDKALMRNILNLIYNVNCIPNKIKFKVLDIQDVFNNCEKALSTSASGIVNVETKPPTVWKSPTNIVPNKELDPLQPKPVQVKPVLVQFKSNSDEILQPKEHNNKIISNVIINPITKPIVVESTYNITIDNKNIDNKTAEILDNTVLQQSNVNNRQRNYRNNRNRQPRNNDNQPRNNDNQPRNNDNQPRNNDNQPRNNDNQPRNNDNQQRNRNRQRNNNNKGFKVAEASLDNALTDDGFIKIERKNKVSAVNANVGNINNNTNSNYRPNKT